MIKLPKVLVPMAQTTLPGDIVSLSVVRQTIVNSLVRHGLIPIFISPGISTKMADQIFWDTQAIFLVGGSDADPKHFNQQPHSRTQTAVPARDELELYLLKLAAKADPPKPIFGVCRGAQMINVAAGGTLNLYLPDKYPHEVHEPTDGQGYNYLITGQPHPVVIHPNTTASAIFKKKSIKVNSHHHQGVDILGSGLKASVTSPAGVIEMIESIDPMRTIIGTQWHPEAEDSPISNKLFAYFAHRIHI